MTLTVRPIIGTLAGIVVALLFGACTSGSDTGRTRTVAGGDPARGPIAMRAYGCHGCHTIPGVRGATGTVGPSLDGMAHRRYIAGVVGNTPDGLIRWIRNPRAVAPGTAMPDVGVTEADARHMAAYLLTLR